MALFNHNLETLIIGASHRCEQKKPEYNVFGINEIKRITWDTQLDKTIRRTVTICGKTNLWNHVYIVSLRMHTLK